MRDALWRGEGEGRSSAGIVAGSGTWSVAATRDGGFAVAGQTKRSAEEPYRAFLMKLDAYGLGTDLAGAELVDGAGCRDVRLRSARER